jgi:hypothetical protein
MTACVRNGSQKVLPHATWIPRHYVNRRNKKEGVGEREREGEGECEGEEKKMREEEKTREKEIMCERGKENERLYV